MRRMISVTMLLALGCGGNQKSVRDAGDEPDAAHETPGTRCVRVAQTARQPLADAPIRMDLSHILVRHAGVRDAGEVTRTREEACLRATEARKKLLSGADWEDVYAGYSDSKDSTGGEFFGVTQSSLEEKFGNAAFSLKVDELSHVVETKNGFHVIWRMK